MGRIRKDAFDLDFLSKTSNVKFVGPKRIGYFSSLYDKDHKLIYRLDNSSQRYLVSTELTESIDCLEGFNIETDKCSFPEGWEHAMHWVRSNEQIISHLTSHGDSKSSIDFICTNSSLRNMLLLLYTKFDWIINAIKIEGTIYLFVSDEDPLKKRVKESDNDTVQNKLSFARFKVIKKITRPVETSESESNIEMNALTNVLFSKIGQHRMIHFGNCEFVMSQDDQKSVDQANFAALKLRRNLYKQNGDFNLPFYRHMYWWASALLCGVKTLICGDLEDDFTLRKLDVLPVSVLNKRTAPNQRKCFSVLDKILDFIKSQVQENEKFYDIRYNFASKEVISSLSVTLIEDNVSPQLNVNVKSVV